VNSTQCFATRVSFAVAGTLIQAGVACAQEAPFDDMAPSDSHVPVLTPTHMRQPIRDIPASVTILSADTLATYGFLGIDEAVRMVAGTGPNRLAWANYGLSIDKKSSSGPERVMVLIDGIEVGGLPLSDGDDWPIVIDDVDRIEILRGPGTSGYGHALVTAVVNIVTKHPADVERAYGRATFGSYRTINLFARGGMTLGPAAMRLTFSHRERAAAADDSSEGIRLSRVGIDRLTLRTATRLGDASTLAFDAAYLVGHISGDANASPPLDRRERRSGYASTVWTRDIDSTNELRVRLDHWASTQDSVAADCVTVGALDGLSDAQASTTALDGPTPAGFASLLERAAPSGKACNTTVQFARRTKLELQDTHVFSDQLRVVGGLGVRQEQARTRDPGATTASWSATVRRAFAGIEWRTSPAMTVNAGLSADDASNEVHGLSFRTGANWHLSDDQTVRLAWSAGNWASDASRSLGLAGNLVTKEHVKSADLGYLLLVPSSNATLNARIFWTRLTGRVWNKKAHKDSVDQPADGEIYGVELRGTTDLGANWSGFLGLSTMTEGRTTGEDTGHSVWPWSGSVGLSTTFGDGWRASIAYYAASKRETSRQTFGRADLAVVKDFFLADVRARAAVTARRNDHIRSAASGDAGMADQNGVASAVYVSLQVFY